MSRRRAFALLGLGTASVAAGIAGWVTGAGAPARRTRLEPGASGEALRQPDVAQSRDGVLDVTLTAAAGVRTGGPGHLGLGIQRHLAGTDPAGAAR